MNDEDVQKTFVFWPCAGDCAGSFVHLADAVLHGPGIRTTVFFKGCHLRCKWCHNPETLSALPQIMFYHEKCSGCGKCVATCPQNAHRFAGEEHVYDRTLCKQCGHCVAGCARNALEVVGKTYTCDELLELIEQDQPFYASSGGGVTFSGGDCMCQIDFLQNLLKGCKDRGIHTAVDTSGFFAWEQFEKILPLTDVFLYDIKAFDRDLHIACTGVPNDGILRNAIQLDRCKASMIIRIPVIPEHNDSLENAMQVAELISSLETRPQVELLPYNKLGMPKYKALDYDYGLSEQAAADTNRMQQLEKIYQDKGCNLRHH